MSAGNGKKIDYGFTPVEQKMFNRLGDGEPHTREELHACLWDEAGAISNIRIHICNMRKKLRIHDEDILLESKFRRLHYRWVGLIRIKNPA